MGTLSLITAVCKPINHNWRFAIYAYFNSERTVGSDRLNARWIKPHDQTFTKQRCTNQENNMHIAQFLKFFGIRSALDNMNCNSISCNFCGVQKLRMMKFRPHTIWPVTVQWIDMNLKHDLSGTTSDKVYLSETKCYWPSLGEYP